MIDTNSDKYKKTRNISIKKEQCNGCEDDFYNGHNDFGIKECWHFKSATLVMKKKVALDERPPHKQSPIRLPSCFHQKGFIFMRVE